MFSFGVERGTIMEVLKEEAEIAGINFIMIKKDVEDVLAFEDYEENVIRESLILRPVLEEGNENLSAQ